MAIFPARSLAIHICIVAAGLLTACSDGPSDATAVTTNPFASYYVDCTATAPGDGTLEAPWNTLEAASAVTLGPGESLLLRRGSVCNGMLKPRGSGSDDDRIRIGAYGDGPLPRIDANGVNTAALWIEDMSHVVVRDLELTNRGDVNDSEQYRGVYLTTFQGRVADIEIRDLYIHDVTSRVEFCCGKRGGAIIANSMWETPDTQFDGVLIENNRIEDVGRSGIYFDGSSAGSGDRPRASEHWPAGGQGIVIRGNTLKRLQGDAIVAHGTDSAVIEDNVVSVGNLAGRNWLSPERNCAAGIWTWNSINTLIQRNEVSGYRFGQSERDGCDGTGFDIDNEQEGTIIQYNYSHNNEGGFILLCSDDEPHTAHVRYNLSIDDGKVINASPCKAPIVGTFSDIRMYNNTFVTAKPLTGIETIPLEKFTNAGDFQFANNIIYATAVSTNLIACGDRCSNNLFYNLPPVGNQPLVDDPLFEDVAWRGDGRVEAAEAFRLRDGSPAIDAGISIEGGVEEDFFGNEVPATPALGIHQPR